MEDFIVWESQAPLPFTFHCSEKIIDISQQQRKRWEQSTHSNGQQYFLTITGPIAWTEVMVEEKYNVLVGKGRV